MNTVRPDKFSIEIFLVVVAKYPDNQFLTLKVDNNTTFPSEFLRISESPEKIAEKLLFDYTGVSSNWATINSVGIISDPENNEVIPILYTCFIPEPTRIRIDDTTWLTYNDIIPKTLFLDKLIYEAIWRG